jgi:bromodomain adjacent to zinc finger domain protein 1A
LQDGSYDKQCETLAWGGHTSHDTPFESRIASALASRDTTRPSTPDPAHADHKRDSTGSGAGAVSRQNRKIRDLACAVLQIGQMMDPKYLKDPLGEDEKEKKKRMKEEEKKKKVK